MMDDLSRAAEIEQFKVELEEAFKEENGSPSEVLNKYSRYPALLQAILSSIEHALLCSPVPKPGVTPEAESPDFVAGYLKSRSTFASDIYMSLALGRMDEVIKAFELMSKVFTSPEDEVGDAVDNFIKAAQEAVDIGREKSFISDKAIDVIVDQLGRMGDDYE